MTFSCFGWLCCFSFRVDRYYRRRNIFESVTQGVACNTLRNHVHHTIIADTFKRDLACVFEEWVVEQREQRLQARLYCGRYVSLQEKEVVRVC